MVALWATFLCLNFGIELEKFATENPLSPQRKSDDIFKFNWCYAVVYQMHYDLDL